MEKVVTINLNGNPYQLDESAYAAVSSYLARTAEALKNNPDRDEIIADIEQAIADKCANFVGPGKTVISSAEMDRALAEMGEVEDDTPRGAEEPEAQTESASSSSSSSQGEEKRTKRLYRVPSGAMIAGVCNGIASYFNIDPAIVRILFIVAAIITHGWALIAYLILMFVIPAPHTPEEWAAAHNAPFNAQEVIDRAKREYNDFATRGGLNDWSTWYGPKYARRAAKRANRAARRAARSAARASARGAAAAAYWGSSEAWGSASGYTPPTTPTGALARAFAGIFAFAFGIVSAALTIAFLITVISLIATGAVLGWIPPGGMPIWAIVLIIVVIFFSIGGPISAFRRAAYGVMNGRPSAMYHTFDGLVWIGMLGLGAWLAYLYVPAAHAWMDHAQVWLNQAWDSLQRSWEAGTSMPPASQPTPLPAPASPGTPP